MVEDRLREEIRNRIIVDSSGSEGSDDGSNFDKKRSGSTLESFRTALVKALSVGENSFVSLPLFQKVPKTKTSFSKTLTETGTDGSHLMNCDGLPRLKRPKRRQLELQAAKVKLRALIHKLGIFCL